MSIEVQKQRGTTRRRQAFLLLGVIPLTLLILLLGGWSRFGLAAPASATWSSLQPTGWVTHLPMTASLTVTDPSGLLSGTVAYQTTTDGGQTWTDWKTDFISVAQPVTTQLAITVTQLTWPDSLADNAIRFRVQNMAGITATSPAYTVPVDTQPPHVEVTRPAAGSVVESFQVAGTSDDATSGVNRVLVQLQDDRGRSWDGTGWTTATTWLTATGTMTWTYTGSLPAEEGVYAVRARAEDAAGWTGEADPVTVTVDLSPPSAPQHVAIQPADWTPTNAFTVTWTNPDDPAGIAGAYYKVQSPPNAPTDGTFVAGTDIEHLTGITLPVEGDIPVFVWLQDGLGHVDHTTAAVVQARYDATPPGAPTDLVAAPSGWQSTNDFFLSWSNPADTSGIAGAYYRFNSEPTSPTDGFFVAGDDLSRIEHLQVPGEGIFDVYLWLVDRAGNVDQRKRNVLTAAFKYDATPPVVSMEVEGTLGENGWYTTPITVHFNALDALSGLDVIQYRLDEGLWVTGDTLYLDTNGEHQLTYFAVDHAGNQSTPVTETLAVDTTPPAIRYSLPPLPTGETWYRKPVTVSVQIEEEDSGLDAALYRLDNGPWQPLPANHMVRVIPDGLHTLYLKAQDRAGNVTSVGPIDIPVDRSAPVTAYVVDGVLGDNNWYVSPVTVTLTPTDTASGVVATYYRIDEGPWQEGTQFVITEDGEHTIEFYSVDAAGWQEQGFPTPIWIDTTPPPAPPYVWAVPDTWTNRNHFQVQWATPSDLSQVVGAYYKLDAPPEDAQDGTFVPGGRSIPDIQVPEEGSHTLYLWLQDGAGNVDASSPAVLADGLRYDATPPTTSVELQGVRGNDGWWRSPVTATFIVTDALSGPESTFVSLDGAAWQETTQLTIGGDDKHELAFYSVDAAGNREAARDMTIKIDTEAPPAPPEMSIITQGWQHENRFIVRWQPPLDLSGISGIRYTIDRAPVGPDDGTFSPGSTSAVIRAPGEGIFDVYIWLVDGAGNSDPTTAQHFPRALWYDNTPPSLQVTVNGPQGANGWYTGPVSIQVTTADAASGEATAWMQINGGTPITLTEPYTLTEEGRYDVRIWSVDAAGNRTEPWEETISIDTRVPQVEIEPLPVYMTDFVPLQGGLVSFRVRWRGMDSPHGSGVVRYDLQVREGIQGKWTLWLSRTTETEGVFIGQVGHTYFFRARAYDAAGHVSAYTRSLYGDAYTHIESVRNGSFETGNLLYWMAARVPQPDVGGRGLKITVKSAQHYAGGESLAVWLGDPEYGGAEQPGLVPIGAAVISQTVQVPPLSQMSDPTLEFWYHMVTWDVRYSPSHRRWQDTFELRILSPEGKELDRPLRDGYESQHVPPKKYVDFAVKHDLGWRRFRYDLTPYAGQTIIIEFSNWNRWDNQYNTYTIVDDVRIVDPALTPRLFLPMVSGGGTPSPAREGRPEELPPITEEPSETLER